MEGFVNWEYEGGSEWRASFNFRCILDLWCDLCLRGTFEANVWVRNGGWYGFFGFVLVKAEPGWVIFAEAGNGAWSADEGVIV